MKEYQYINILKNIIDDDLNIIGDDTAVIKESGLVLTCDTLVENVHFSLQTTAAKELGYKAGAVNLSDIAASGGKCKYLLVSLALPEYIDETFIRDFYQGLKTICDKFSCHVVGGDLVSAKELVITVTAVGKTKVNASRAFAKEGQLVMTTGTYGDSFAGLQLLQKASEAVSIDSENYLKRAHLLPEPRLFEANYIIKNCDYVHYCLMDTSDGLADAVYQIAQKSNVTINIDISKVPVSEHLLNYAKVNNLDPVNAALYGGEDFELIFTINKEDLTKFKNNNDFKFTLIGEVCNQQPGVKLIFPDKNIDLTKQTLERNISFKHF